MRRVVLILLAAWGMGSAQNTDLNTLKVLSNRSGDSLGMELLTLADYYGALTWTPVAGTARLLSVGELHFGLHQTFVKVPVFNRNGPLEGAKVHGYPVLSARVGLPVNLEMTLLFSSLALEKQSVQWVGAAARYGLRQSETGLNMAFVGSYQNLSGFEDFKVTCGHLGWIASLPIGNLEVETNFVYSLTSLAWRINAGGYISKYQHGRLETPATQWIVGGNVRWNFEVLPCDIMFGGNIGEHYTSQIQLGVQL